MDVNNLFQETLISCRVMLVYKQLFNQVRFKVNS